MTPEEQVKLLLFGRSDYSGITSWTASGETHFRVTYPELVAAIREAVKAEREACREALAFAASCIKSGEPWTTECARIIDGALAKAKRPA